MGFLINWYKRFKEFITSFRAPVIRVVMCTGDSFPTYIPSRQMIVLDDDGLYAAGFSCPCGCGDIVELILMEGVIPRWDLEVDDSNLPSLHPSIWKQNGCCSHFWIKHGRVVWCSSI